MSNLTDYAENKVIDALLRGQALGAPSTWYLTLYSAAPGETGGGTEITTGGMTRLAVAASLAAWAGTQGAGTTTASSGSSGETSNNAQLTFPNPTAVYTVSAFGLLDAASGGNLWIYDVLRDVSGNPITRTFNPGDPPPRFDAGALRLIVG